MNLLTNEFTFLSRILLVCLCDFVCSSNPTNLPIISVEKPPTLKYGSKITIQFSGDRSILYPMFEDVVLICRANYPIRWDSTIPVKSYDLPKKYMVGEDYGQDGLPKHYSYETTIRITTNSRTAGFVLCLKLGNSRNSSELMIFGSEAEEFVQMISLRDGLKFEWMRWEAYCRTVTYRQRNDKNTNWRYIDTNSELESYTQFGLAVTSNFGSIEGYEFCKMGQAVRFKITRGNPGNLDDVPKLTQFLGQRAPNCSHENNCIQWSCSNPLHCMIVIYTVESSVCPQPNAYIPGLQQRNCSNYHDLYSYLYAGIDESNPRFRFEHSTLMTISGPRKDQMVASKSVEFTCSAVSFLFGQQIVFGIKFQNNSVQYYHNFWKPDEVEKHQYGDVFSNTLELTLKCEMTAIICLAPRFDSELWFNVSTKFNVTHCDEETIVSTTESISATSTAPNGGGEGKYSRSSTLTETQTPNSNTVSGSGKENEISTTVRSKTTTTSNSVRDLTSSWSTTRTEPQIPLPNVVPRRGKVETRPRDDDEVSNSTTVVAVVAVVFALCLVVGSCCGLLYASYRKKFRALTEQEIEEFRYGIYRLSVARNIVSSGLGSQITTFQNEISDAEIQIDRDNLVAQDAFMSVFPATIKGRTAIVKTTDQKTTTLFFKEFLKDIKVMNRISICSQPNIVEFLGALTPNIQNRVICAGFEASSFGNLKDFLRSNSGNPINLMAGSSQTRFVAEVSEGNQHQVSTLTMLQWSDQIATAMAFLQRENLVHGDLSASNVLLFPENCVKISDLSAWRKQYERDFYLRNYQPPPKWRWMAIELFRSKKFTIKSDVWAYGVTLWEIFSLGEDPYPGIRWSPDFVVKLEGGYRMEKPSLANDAIYQMLLRCWYLYPNDRSSFGEIKEKICEIIKRL